MTFSLLNVTNVYYNGIWNFVVICGVLIATRKLDAEQKEKRDLKNYEAIDYFCG